MKTKSLTTTNRYLKKASCGKMMARNIASSTSVETGKDSSIYVKRYTSVRMAKVATTLPPKPRATKTVKSPKKVAS